MLAGHPLVSSIPRPLPCQSRTKGCEASTDEANGFGIRRCNANGCRARVGEANVSEMRNDRPLTNGREDSGTNRPDATRPELIILSRIKSPLYRSEPMRYFGSSSELFEMKELRNLGRFCLASESIECLSFALVQIPAN
jgi:hypothetical protein